MDNVPTTFESHQRHWEKGLVSVLMKILFKVSSNGPSTEWVGYETFNFLYEFPYC
jgi:hypothetical protein